MKLKDLSFLTHQLTWPNMVVPSLAHPVDAVEAALAEGIVKATTAGQWDLVAQLARELEARRKARAGVLELDAERAKRGRP